MNIKAQTFGTAENLSEDWSDDPMDGILGLGYPSISQLQTAPFFQNVCFSLLGLSQANEFFS